MTIQACFFVMGIVFLLISHLTPYITKTSITVTKTGVELKTEGAKSSGSNWIIPWAQLRDEHKTFFSKDL